MDDFEQVVAAMESLGDPEWESMMRFFAPTLPLLLTVTLLVNRAETHTHQNRLKDVPHSIYELMIKCGLTVVKASK